MKAKKHFDKKWLRIVLVGLSILISFAILFVVVGTVINCAYGDATWCTETNDSEHEAEVKSKILEYATKDCYRSYRNEACQHLVIETAGYSCGIMGFCGWLVNISSTSSDFKYRSGASLEDTTSFWNVEYAVTSYGEAESKYTDDLTKVFLEMCERYSVTKKYGCSNPYFNAYIDWLGDSNEENNQNVGTSSESLGPYIFEGKIDRSGKVLEAYITNIDDDEGRILYRYKTTE